MTRTKQIWLAAGILSGVFTTGFLAGISSARPLQQVFPTRTLAKAPQAEDFVQRFSYRLTEHLELTAEQKPKVNEQIRLMADEVRTIQGSLIPQITGSLTNAIDRILPLLNKEQQRILENRRQSIQENSPLNSGPRRNSHPM